MYKTRLHNNGFLWEINFSCKLYYKNYPLLKIEDDLSWFVTECLFKYCIESLDHKYYE